MTYFPVEFKGQVARAQNRKTARRGKDLVCFNVQVNQILQFHKGM